MAAKYTMQEMKDLHRKGETLLYPRMILSGCCDTEELARLTASGSTFSAGEVLGLLRQMAWQMAFEMAHGRSVKIDGVGVFTPSLALRKGKEREQADGEGSRRNAGSIKVGGVNFRPDRKLVGEVNTLCKLERSPQKYVCHTSDFTPEERLNLALRHLDTHPWLTVMEYATLTGLGRTTAGKELRLWNSTPGSGLRAKGSGSHRVYVRTSTATD